MFGPESTATGRSPTSVESRAPVAGSRPFVRLSTGDEPGSSLTTAPKTALGTATSDEIGIRYRGVGEDVERDPAEVRSGHVARVAPARAHGFDLCGVARGERDVVPVVAQEAAERRPPRAGADHHDLHSEVTKSMETGTPSSPKRRRSSFSTQ